MYFSALRKSIQSLEEKKFYDIAITFLNCEGYKEISIVDGSGDGGRDVVCSRQDLRIQLSVRKDWAQKINDEAALTKKEGKRHIIYITNRPIRESEKAEFLASKYKLKGEIDLTIIDLNRISTALSHPGVIQRAYAQLGMIVDKKVSASPKEIAISNLLLFSTEAKDLRENVIESNLKAFLFKSPKIDEAGLIGAVVDLLPGVDIEANVRTAFSRLLSRGEILKKNGELSLHQVQIDFMTAAEEEYNQSTILEKEQLQKEYNISPEDTQKLIQIVLEISARDKQLDGDGLQEIELADFISNKELGRRKAALYSDLSKLAVARVKQYGKAVDHIFSTNTFDIYRTLGKNSDIVMILDSSVAMPLMFGLSFGSAKSRYGIAAAVLNDLCKEHNIKVMVPRCYLNEMASHGMKAVEFMDTYNALAEDAKDVLKNAKNAYLSHYSHIRDLKNASGSDLTISEFLGYFGLRRGVKLSNIENHIETVLDGFGIGILASGSRDPEIYEQISLRKSHEAQIIIEHDATVCTLLKNDTNTGYVFATWDRVMIDTVEGLSRVFADTPARVTDFLSMASGAQMESEQSFDLLTSLIYCDEKSAAALARKIEQINSAETAHEFKKVVDAAREKNGVDWQLDDKTVSDFFLEKNIKVDNSID